MSKCKVVLGNALVLLAMPFAAAAGAAQAPEWRLLLEPKFMQRAVSFPIAHAERTVFAPAVATGEGYEFPTRARFDRERLDLEIVRKLNATRAEAELATVQPRYVRDRRNVIIYAEIRAQRPMLASVVLAPKFRTLFQETFGDRVLVVVPSRFAAFVFASLTRDYQQYAPIILEEYRATAFPVSTEVFELSEDGIKAVGMYEDR